MVSAPRSGTHGGRFRPDPNVALESMLSGATLSLIANRVGSGAAPNKKQIGLYLAEAVANRETKEAVDAETVARLSRLIDALSEKLADMK
jgi:hypothetical protein